MAGLASRVILDASLLGQITRRRRAKRGEERRGRGGRGEERKGRARRGRQRRQEGGGWGKEDEEEKDKTIGSRYVPLSYSCR